MLFQTIGKALIVLGLILILIGAFVYLGPRIPFWDKIPGNFRWQKGPVTIYFPLGLCILVSILASLILYFLGKK